MEVERSPHSSDQDGPYQSESKEIYSNGPLAEEEWLEHYEEEMKMERKLGVLLHPKTTQASGIFVEQVVDHRAHKGNPGITSRIVLDPDPI